MHDIQFIRQNADAFDAGLKRRGLAARAREILAIDERRRALLTELEAAQARRNEASKLIGLAKSKKDDATASALMAEVAGLKDKIAAGEEGKRKIEAELEAILAELPNLPAEDVPDGADESANDEKRREGRARKFGFPAKEHFDLGEALGQMDFAAAARMSGARFVVLKKDLARLERALANFMLDLHTKEFGYTEVSPPILVRDQTMFGTAQLPKFRDDQFQAFHSELLRELGQTISDIMRQSANLDPATHFSDEANPKRLWLIPTAEVPLTNLVREQILSEDALPLRFTAYTPCFRAEAGAAGKDTRGMIRLHQFPKVELVSVTAPEHSQAEHERMTACAEEVLKRLELHFRTMVLCTGDMGFAARKTYDIEVWLPGQNRFREISSCSNCGDFQARRMGARYRPAADTKGTRFVHTLNGSGLAVGRTLVAVLENYQQADGSIAVPAALRPYLGGQDMISA
jgi:seryl-tRNA synthetase